MAYQSYLLSCLAKSASRHGLGEQLVADAWAAWGKQLDEGQRRTEVALLATTSQAQAKVAASEVVRKFCAALPPEQRRQVAAWLTQTPSAVRRALRRTDDPSGRTIVEWQTPQDARDLGQMLWPRAPRFNAGDRPRGVGDYQLEELLNVSGRGEVWKAKVPGCPDVPPVTLTFVLQGKAELVRLDHPGVVGVNQLHSSAEPPCLEGEYVAAGDLAGLINEWHRTGQMTPARAKHLVLDLCGVIAFAHEHGCVHGALNASSVLALPSVDGGVSPRVIGFGLGECSDPREDVLALGAIWYQLLTGKVWESSAPLDGIPVEVRSPLASCLEDDVARRPRDAKQMLRLLRRKPKREVVQRAGVAMRSARERFASAKIAERGGRALSQVRGHLAAFGKHRSKLAGRAGLLVVGAVLLLTALPAIAWMLSPLGRGNRIEASEDRDTAKVHTTKKHAYPALAELPRELNQEGVRLVYIPAGTFSAVSFDSEGERRHLVGISQPILMGAYEVRQKEFRALMGYNPSYFSHRASGKPDVGYVLPPGGGKDKVSSKDTEEFPVENVSYDEATRFAEELNRRTEGKRPEGYVYRLPTEAEWEYACRGGATGFQPFHFGEAISSAWANFDGRYPYGKAAKGDFLERTTTVGQYNKPNGYGLHDMHGNVWEWCSTWFDDEGNGGSLRVIRGGGYRDFGMSLHSGFRDRRDPAWRYDYLGFRVVLAPVGG